MDRYRPIIDDWDAFTAACDEPSRTTVRRNPIKAKDDFDDRLRDRFPDAEQADWNPNVHRLPGVDAPGKSLLHWRGEYYVQEESAAVPVTVLEPAPGDHVLDMAAAPGGKATQIAGHMENSGLLVANDANHNRLQSLHANVYRCGAACAMVTNYEGQNMPEDDQYDKILVDAPCSGEGNECRRSFAASDTDRSRQLANLQQQLLRKAAALLKPGGTLVYATCTFSPLENEAVVQDTLEITDLSITPIKIDVPYQRGVTTFDDKQFTRDVRNTVRIYPHHLQSGGMYIAKFTG